MGAEDGSCAPGAAGEGVQNCLTKTILWLTATKVSTSEKAAYHNKLCYFGCLLV